VVRINKYLSEVGYCSRRAADSLILEGKVTINGEAACLGSKVNGDEDIRVMGKKLTPKSSERVIIAFNKPAGVECTAAKDVENNIIDYIGYKTRIYPVGRLDKASRGLILLTDDGELTNKLLRASEGHEKEYIVRVNKTFDDAFLENMSKGVPILGKVTAPCKLKRVSSDTFNIILRQGLNRQIRRMCEYFGLKVVDLKRIRFENIKLGSLKEGTYRTLTKEELSTLYDKTLKR